MALVGSALFTIVYHLVAAGLLRRWLGGTNGTNGTNACPLEPVTFFRPIKSGERAIEGGLRTFLEAIEPGDRVIFGASGERERSLCAGLAAEFPRLDIQCPPLADVPALNPKVA